MSQTGSHEIQLVRNSDFPETGIMPKEDTQAARWLEERPEQDGRGVIVAIFDTGVDMGAEGLQMTPDGRPKIVDVVECSGSGDVDMTTKRQASEEGTLEGLSGRTLRLNPSWSNPSGEWRLGLKHSVELYSHGLAKRMSTRAKEEWSKEHARLLANAHQELAQYLDSLKHTELSREEEERRLELTARVDLLNSLASDREAIGAVYDCIAWHDGSTWRAAVDTSEMGDLTEAEGMASFREERVYAELDKETGLHYACNIYDDGNVLSIVTDAGAHGTHVAGIVAGYYPEQPELNGIAPGAQIVSVKIGDTRLGSMETGTGLIRALRAVIDNGVHICNMSYGEPSSRPNFGRFVELLQKTVREHNIIFVSSAGNAGPALTTVGAPGGTATDIIGVGAMVSPHMQLAGYSMRDTVSPINYTWSSRGPAADGALGVSISAPGGAIAPVPKWTQQRNMLMNGTSMSSPNAAGNIALLVSACIAEGVPYTPHSVKMAIENTAIPLVGSDSFGLGNGLLQIYSAWECHRRIATGATRYPRIHVRVPNHAAGGAGARLEGRGVYWREGHQSDISSEVQVMIDTDFDARATNDERVNFEVRVALVSTAEDWIQCPTHMVLMHGGRGFNMLVNARALEYGVHYAEVRGYDVDAPEVGPIFRVPVTVVKPQNPRRTPGYVDLPFGAVHFSPGHIERRFIRVPEGAMWADVHVRRLDYQSGETAYTKRGTGTELANTTAAVSYKEVSTDSSSRMIVVHAVQILPHTSPRDSTTQKWLRIKPGSSYAVPVPLQGRQTLEVAVAQFWSSLGDCDIAIDVVFRGVTCSPQEVTLHGDSCFTSVQATAMLEDATIKPEAKLTHAYRTLTPVTYDLKPLTKRDVLADGKQQYALTLTYKHTLKSDQTLKPLAPRFNRVLYEAGYDSQLLLVLDSNGRVRGVSDAFPEELKLKKGSYTFKLQVRHEDYSLLEKAVNSPLQLHRKLNAEVKCGVHPTQAAAAKGSRAYGQVHVTRGSSTRVYISAPAPLKDVEEGEVCLGTLSLAQYDEKLPGSSRNPSPFKLVFYPATKSSAKVAYSVKEIAPEEEEVSEEAKAARVARDAVVKQLPQLSGAAFEAAYAFAAEQDPTHLPLLSAAVTARTAKWPSVDAGDVEQACARLLDTIDTTKVAAYFGVNHDITDAAEAAEEKRMKERRDAIVLAIAAKAKAQARTLRELCQSSEESETLAAALRDASYDSDEFDQSYALLSQWTEVKAETFVVVSLERMIRKHKFGQMLQLLRTIGDEKKDGLSTPQLAKLREVALCALGWDAWLQWERDTKTVHCPPTQALF